MAKELHIGTVIFDKKIDFVSSTFMFPYSCFNSDFLKHYPLHNFTTNTIKLFDNFHERESVYNECKNLAYSYVAKFKREYEKDVVYPEIFYILILFPYYFTVINFTFARYLYIKKFISLNMKEDFFVNTFEMHLPKKFETKKEFLTNLYTNIDLQEWLVSVILTKLDFENVIIRRSKGKVNIYTIENIKKSFYVSLFSFFSKLENILKFHRVIFFLLASLVAFLPYSVTSFNNIYGVGAFRSLLYSAILNMRGFKKREKVKKTPDGSDSSHLKFDFPDEFVNILDEVIAYTLPNSHGVFFDKYKSQAENENTFVRGKVRFDSTGFMDDQKSFKHACSVLNGEKLVFVQHGSNYCTTANSWAADSYEYQGDYFVNWGNVTPKKRHCEFIVMPSPSLSRLKDKHKCQNQSLVLVGTNQRQTMDGICIADPAYCWDYLRSKENFISGLSQNVLSSLLYRPWLSQDTEYFNDEKYMRSLFPDLKILTGNLTKEILKTRLLVLDHYGTAFYEAMAANTPVMIYFGYPECAFTQQAQEMFEEFKKAGIFYDDAESAAKAINVLWDDVEEWWFSENVQNARKKFNYLFALTDRNWNWQWIKLLFKIS